MASLPQPSAAVDFGARARVRLGMRNRIASTLVLLTALCAVAVAVATRALDRVDVDVSAVAPDLRLDALAGHVLVATDIVDDADFRGARIYVLHHDAHGAAGVVLNHPVGRAIYGVPLYVGGPVGAGSVVVLHDDIDRGVVVEDGVVAAGHDPALMQAIARGAGPARAKAFVGYAGWGPGQLEHELAAGAWAVVEVDADRVFAP